MIGLQSISIIGSAADQSDKKHSDEKKEAPGGASSVLWFTNGTGTRNKLWATQPRIVGGLWQPDSLVIIHAT